MADDFICVDVIVDAPGGVKYGFVAEEEEGPAGTHVRRQAWNESTRVV